MENISVLTTEERYRKIIAAGEKLEPIPADKKTDAFLVKGCVSRAWLVPEMRGDVLHFYADSEATIVKGVIATLLDVYNDHHPKENLHIDPKVITDLGLTEHLSMNRRNGLSSFVKQILLYSTIYSKLLEDKK